MIENLPGHISVVFILITLLTVGIFVYAIFRAGLDSLPAKVLLAFVLVWVTVEALLALNGFFQNFDVQPLRTFAFGPLPFFALTIIYLIFFRKFLADLPLAVLTWIHVIRIPVEFVLLLLFQNGQVPVEMTFEGRNFDILSGITAPIVYFLAFRNGKVNRPLLFVWNLAALALLVNIVTIAVLAFPSPFQMVGLRQPNVGVTFFPFIWLPAVVVPIVFFCHVASLWQLSTDDSATE
ncbi:MAG: hypothetical protein ABI857_06625 [Acidobacteriota bacterium]